MSNIAIIEGNPKSGPTFTGALADAYLRGARAGGHEARLFRLSALEFDPVLHEGFDGDQPLEPDIKAAQEAIGAADHLVFVWPLWFGTMPALLKGFIERTFQPGFAVEGLDGRSGWPKKLLKGKSARIVMTMGMPGFVYRTWFGAHALKVLKRNILGFCGVGPIRSTVYGMVDGSAARRTRWLDEMEEMGRRAG